MDWDKVRPNLLRDIEDQLLDDIKVEYRDGEFYIVNAEVVADNIISLLEHIDYLCNGNLLKRKKENGRRKIKRDRLHSS